jgi:glycosyltransferase involved in cell wall biosynthesis
MDDHDIYQHSLAMRASLRLGLRRAALVTGCSAFTLRDAENRFGLDMARARVIFNGVDLEDMGADPVDLPFDRYVLALGRVVPKKGFDLLLEAFARIASSVPNVGLVIAGDGPERGPLQQRALDLGLRKRVYLPGQLSQAEVNGVMRDAEVFVMPSRVEPFGIVALEAWRAGVPLIASSRGGAGEFVEHGVSGLVVDPSSPVALETALQSLLGSSDLRSELSRAGLRQVQRFAWPRLAGLYADLYAQVAPVALSQPSRETPSS